MEARTNYSSERVPREREFEQPQQQQQQQYDGSSRKRKLDERNDDDDTKGEFEREGSVAKRSKDCFRCGGTGHVKMECVSSLDAIKDSAFICFKCSGRGHYARDCPNIRGDICYCCGMMGHHGLDCPSNLKRKGPPARMRFGRGNGGMFDFAASMYGSFGYPYGPYSEMANMYAPMMAGANSPGAAGVNGTGVPNPLLQQQVAPPMMDPFVGGRAAAGSGCFRCGSTAHLARDCTAPKQPFFPSPPSMQMQGMQSLMPGMQMQMQGIQGMQSMPMGGVIKPDFCWRCGDSGHFFRDCKLAEGEHLSRDSCFKCGRPGHFSKDCVGPDKRVCFVCHKLGHVAKQCPQQVASQC